MFLTNIDIIPMDVDINLKTALIILLTAIVVGTIASICGYYVASICDYYVSSKKENPTQTKQGYWIQVDDTKCRCSECDVIALIALYPNGDKNYCPNCGMPMVTSDKTNKQ